MRLATRHLAVSEGHQSGGAILALLQKAADVAQDEYDQALAMARELALRLREAEDRAHKLEAQVKQLEGDAQKAEDWLGIIHKEIADKFLQKKDMRSQRL